jgi:uncharacterized protein YutE (UPF0331/DUF86 family)
MSPSKVSRRIVLDRIAWVDRMLADCAVLSADESALLKVLPGCRNRLAHFYHEVSIDELYEIYARELGDLEAIKVALVRRLTAHPKMVDETF